MVHPREPTCVAAASRTSFAAAALSNRHKHCVHAGNLRPGHTFVPASVRRTGFSASHLAVHSHIEQYSFGLLLRCLPEVAPCYRPSGSEHVSCEESGLRVLLLCAALAKAAGRTTLFHSMFCFTCGALAQPGCLWVSWFDSVPSVCLFCLVCCNALSEARNGAHSNDSIRVN
jgi:hypothetical protein